MTDFELKPVPPFRLVPTVRVLQRRPNNRVDVLEDGRFYRVLHTADGPRLVVAEDAGSVDRPLVRVTIPGEPLSPPAAAAAADTLGDMLGTGVDVSGFYRLASEDPRLRPAATALRGLKPPHFETIFEAVVNSVVFQQITLAAGVAIAGRLAERFGQSVVIDGRRYYGPAEPTAVAVASTADLRALGLSERKADVLRHLADLVLAGELSFEALRSLPSGEAICRLDALPGIGRWTAELILLRGLGCLDVFPSGDVGVRRGLARLLGREQPLAVDEEQPLAARFGEQRGLLYFLSLGWRLLQEGLIEPANEP
ncbi:MAG: DNA-3-methyladenine glycosylase family protein [Chloroflexota bacterium]